MKLFNLNTKDFLKGLIMSILSSIITGLYSASQTGQIPTDIESLKVIGLTGLGAGTSYLVKNFLTNESGEFLKK